MIKRIASALLWFLAGWWTWSFIAFAVGLTPVWGPVLGATLAAIFAGDPMHRIWTCRERPDRINSQLKSVHVQL